MVFFSYQKALILKEFFRVSLFYLHPQIFTINDRACTLSFKMIF